MNVNIDFEYLQNGNGKSQALKIHTIEAHNAHNYIHQMCVQMQYRVKVGYCIKIKSTEPSALTNKYL